MKYPRLNEIPVSRSVIDTFGGYNHKLRIGDGELYDCENLSSDHYPVLSTRERRGYGNPRNGKILGMIAKKHLYIVEADTKVVDGKTVELDTATLRAINENGDYIETGYVSGSASPYGFWKSEIEDVPIRLEGLSNSPKNLISMGSYIIILPDNKWINTVINVTNEDYDEDMQENWCEYEIESGTINEAIALGEVEVWWQIKDVPNMAALTQSGTYHICSEEAPSDETLKAFFESIPTVGIGTVYYYWIDISKKPYNCYAYSYDKTTETISREDRGRTRARIYCNTFKDMTDICIEDTVIFSGIKTEGLTNLNGEFTVVGKGEAGEYIEVEFDIIDNYTSVSDELKIQREAIPYMDYIIESQNRLWGCRYGLNRAGKFVNEIYASKLGDFNVWQLFEGTANDSYAASIGTDGKFTGAIVYGDTPIFFKENYMHRVYGNYPENYQITADRINGVQTGCENSLVIIKGVLLYKAKDGVYAFDGSLPQKISEPLGDMSHFIECSAGVYKDKYYLTVRDCNSADGITSWYLDTFTYVYDTQNAIWHKEGFYGGSKSANAPAYCNYNGELFIVKNGGFWTTGGKGTVSKEPSFKWKAETGLIGVSEPDKMYISRIDARMMLEVGARAMFFIEYDSSSAWEYLFTMTGTSLQSFTVPIRPRRCDHFRIKMQGEGDMKLFSLCKIIEQGSDA